MQALRQHCGTEQYQGLPRRLGGPADKGLFITTGRFTRDAEREAVREGAMAIDLIDGEQLCLLLKEKDLGVIIESVERVTPDRAFFDAL